MEKVAFQKDMNVVLVALKDAIEELTKAAETARHCAANDVTFDAMGRFDVDIKGIEKVLKGAKQACKARGTARLKEV